MPNEPFNRPEKEKKQKPAKPIKPSKTFEFYELTQSKGAADTSAEAPATRQETGEEPPRRRRTSSRRKKKLRILRNRIIAGVLLLGIIVLVVVLVTLNTRGENFLTTPEGANSGTESQTIEKAPYVPPESEYTGSEWYEADLPLLCNAWTPLPDGYEAVTASVGYRDNGQEIFMETKAAAAFLAMQAAAEKDGITLMPYSGWRSHARQLENYNNSINSYVRQGKTRKEAEELTQAYYAIPGTSEHEAGLAIDINSIETSFERTDAFAWLQENCTDYGFILRYPNGKKDITGIAYEPWHYRYVGINHAKAIEEAGLTLEEYIDSLTGMG